MHRNSTRILDCLAMGPMPIQAVAKALTLNDENVRSTMQRLEAKGLVKRVGFAKRERRVMGASPYLWTIARARVFPNRPGEGMT